MKTNRAVPLFNVAVVAVVVVLAVATLMVTVSAQGENKPPPCRCAQEVGLSDAGKEKLKEIFKRPGSGGESISLEERMKLFEQKKEEAKAALQETDGDKFDAWEKCLIEARQKFMERKEE